ncbi:MAG: DUF2272 domain-containing protein [Methylococcaceae bacterium]
MINPAKPFLLVLYLSLLAGCALSPPQKTLSVVDRRLVDLAISEWNYFGRQILRLDRDREIIDPVGYWEDEALWAERVRQYWGAVGRPEISGYDCKEPWSAAFISWLMKTAGVPGSQFRRSDAHWVYLDEIIEHSTRQDSRFMPHKLSEYRPGTGDLICAYREPEEKIRLLEAMSRIPPHTRLHCDVVVYHGGSYLEAIGGNVKNSVTKSVIPLDANAYLKPSAKRQWFMAVELKPDQDFRPEP